MKTTGYYNISRAIAKATQEIIDNEYELTFQECKYQFCKIIEQDSWETENERQYAKDNIAYAMKRIYSEVERYS